MTSSLAAAVERPADRERVRYDCEYLVVGTGAGGSVAGARLAEAGRDVIFLEEGAYHPTGSFVPEVGTMTARLYRNRGVIPILGRPTLAFGEACCVGGGTVINGGLIWRTPPWVLEQWRTQAGLVGYGPEQLARQFETVERDLHVVTTQLEADANRDSARLHAAAGELGWKSVLVPRAVKGCINENCCPTGCIAGAKQSSVQTYLPRAAARGARILTGCRAVRIVHSGGVASRVVAEVGDGPTRRRVEIRCERLVLAAGAVQTPHLLRRSRLSKRAGRSLQFHMNLKIVALFDEPLDAARGTIFTTQVQEFEREGLVMAASNLRPHYLALTLAHQPNATIDRVLGDFRRAGGFVALLQAASRARIESRLGDQPLLHYRLARGDAAAIVRALERLGRLLFRAGAVELYLPVAGSPAVRSQPELDGLLAAARPGRFEIQTVHVMASCPMGSDPARSLVSPAGRLWEARNVFVSDASMLPSNIGESPQGTIMAFAHEIWDRHLAEAPQ